MQLVPDPLSEEKRRKSAEETYYMICREFKDAYFKKMLSFKKLWKLYALLQNVLHAELYSFRNTAKSYNL